MRKYTGPRTYSTYTSKSPLRQKMSEESGSMDLQDQESHTSSESSLNDSNLISSLSHKISGWMESYLENLRKDLDLIKVQLQTLTTEPLLSKKTKIEYETRTESPLKTTS